ncbi:MAG: hypothetical protein K2Z80_32865 [Xanthobacteraceae bacterium]|nr:hypothetical protein [Xanthobacteraceae bacterium]
MTLDPETNVDPDDNRRRRLHEWLFLLLRYAITRDPPDRAAVLAMADELDSLGVRWRPAAPQFFLQTSHEVCDAILASGDRRTAALRKHAARIEHVRLRRAFLAAIDIPLRSDAPEETTGRASREHLWLGLAKR